MGKDLRKQRKNFKLTADIKYNSCSVGSVARVNPANDLHHHPDQMDKKKKMKMTTTEEGDSVQVTINESCTNSIDEVINQYLSDIHKQNTVRDVRYKQIMINESRYHLSAKNRSLFHTDSYLKIGLNPLKDFEPMIVLEYEESTDNEFFSTDNVQFNCFDWWEMWRYLKRSESEFFQLPLSIEEEKKKFVHTYREYKIFGEKCNDIQENFVVISRENRYVKLDEQSVHKLCGIFTQIIEQHLHRFLALRFNVFYNDLLETVSKTLFSVLQPPYDVYSKKILSLIVSICTLERNNNNNCLSMLECVNYLPDKIIFDMISRYQKINIIH